MVSMVDIIFLTVLVAFIITRLYSVFGSHGDKNVSVIIKTMGENDSQEVCEVQDEEENESVSPAEEKSNDLPEPDKTLAGIPSFNKESFLKGACRVFELVVHAFSTGNIENIRGLVNKKVWDALSMALANRQENKLSSEVDFICFDKTEIKDVKMLKNSIRIVVEFISEQVNILRNAEGIVVEGDENFVQKITDIWTFERSLNAKNKNWILVSTKKSA